ncbi:MAG: class I SAM-dependent methyltransferase [Planctomycetes bacterium]|nr:class I SAM-dependent methyltransferase [Planctomycetota bacterium]
MNPDQINVMAEMEQRHWWFVSRRHVLGKLVDRLLPHEPKPLVVDIGCGPGGNLASLGERCRCVGVDASPESIRLATTSFPNVRFKRGMAPDDVADDLKNADLVLMMDVIEHVEDDFFFLSNIAATLRPGALVLITVPADMKLWSPHDEAVLHYRRYDLARLQAVWNGLPLKPRLVAGINRRLYWPIRATRVITRKRARSSGMAGTDFKLPSAPVNRILTGLASGEADRLCRAVDSGSPDHPTHGVSLIAVLERTAGTLLPRRKPASLPPDPYTPPAFT